MTTSDNVLKAERGGKLAGHLVRSLAEIARTRWTSRIESELLPREISERLGISPRADLMLSAADASRVFVELEISRADPVANQAKFLVAMQAGAIGPEDVLLCMLSPHIRPGKRSLSAAFGRHLRSTGVRAFTVSLLPGFTADEVYRLNHTSIDVLTRARLPVAEELGRLVSVVEPRGERDHRIHFAGDVTDVVANLWAWNDAMSGEGADTWAGRAAQFFVHDPLSKTFAPAKFCAFLPASRAGGPPTPLTMTMPIYASLGERDPRFDGHRARQHLTNRLAFRCVAVEGDEDKDRAEAFSRWAGALGTKIKLRTPTFVLAPPSWYCG
jgi:hypothetical protein